MDNAFAWLPKSPVDGVVIHCFVGLLHFASRNWAPRGKSEISDRSQTSLRPLNSNRCFCPVSRHPLINSHARKIGAAIVRQSFGDEGSAILPNPQPRQVTWTGCPSQNSEVCDSWRIDNMYGFSSSRTRTLIQKE